MGGARERTPMQGVSKILTQIPQIYSIYLENKKRKTYNRGTLFFQASNASLVQK